jgi:hypothetical protein
MPKRVIGWPRLLRKTRSVFSRPLIGGVSASTVWPHSGQRRSLLLSLAKTRSPLVSTTWEMGCNVVELGYKRSRRRIMELDDVLAKDKLRWPPRKVFFDGSGLAVSTSR